MAAALAAALGTMLVASVAEAHALLLSSDPKAGATVKAGALDLVLHYNSRVDAGRSRLSLKGPGGSRDIPASAGTTPADVTAHVEDLKPGAYQLHWEALAVDGHVSHGDIAFTVADGR